MAEGLSADYDGLEKQIRECINSFVSKDQQFAACVAGPIVSLFVSVPEEYCNYLLML